MKLAIEKLLRTCYVITKIFYYTDILLYHLYEL